MQTVTIEWLQSIADLRDVPAGQLQWWIDNSKIYELEEEAYLFRIGEPIKGTHVILSGRIRMFVNQSNGVRTIGFSGVKDITGYLPFSRALIATVNGQVVEKLTVMTYPVERMKELIENHFAVGEGSMAISFVHKYLAEV